MTVDNYGFTRQEALFHDELADDFNTERFGGNTGGSIHYVNEAGVSSDVIDELRNNREVASQIERWSQSLHSETGAPSYNLFNRGRWQGAKHGFALMSQCAWAVDNDDVLGTLADVTEGAMFQKMRFELYDEDQQDFWNQWAGEIDLDARMREMARELYKVSQVYVGLWWEKRSFAVRDNQVERVLEEEEHHRKVVEARRAGLEEPERPSRQGNRSRRKVFSVDVPTALTIFDPSKVIPVGSTMFGRERFAYVASREEHQAFASVMVGNVADDTVLRLIERRYTPTEQDKAFCADIGVDPEMLWLMTKDSVFRHTLTRASYERLASPRLKSCLAVLEMKDHLRNSDRAALVGATNFIIVITKGSDKLPAKAAEIANLQEQSRIIARLPVLVGDHRLNVTIVAPPLENTLIESRWQTLDSRLVFRALGTFSPVVQGGNSSGTGLSEMAKIISRGLESRRHMLVRAIEAHIFREIMARNEGVLDEFPSLTFAPKRITLDFNNDVMQAILKLRDRGDISRETTLEEVDFDQDVEVVRRAREKAMYDPTFSSSTPFASPAAQPYQPGQPGQQPGQPPRPGQPVANPTQPQPGRPAPPPTGQPIGTGPAGQPREGGRPAGSRNQRAEDDS